MNDLAIQLQIHQVSSDLTSYQYQKGTITLFINDSQQLFMPTH